MMLKHKTKIRSSSLLLLMILLTACDSATNTAEQTQEMPASVTVHTLTAGTVVYEQTFPGRVAPYRIAQIRPQVSGIVTEMKFNQGSELKPGQALFQIDPPLQSRCKQCCRVTKKRRQVTDSCRQR